MAKLRQNSVVALKPIQRSTISATVFENLLGHVINGNWKEGDRIPAERELSEQLGIGRASLREAVKALELIGVLDSRVGDGTFVCARSEFLSRPLLWAISGTEHSELRELLEARLVIEETLAAFAAERASTEELQNIKAAHEGMRTCFGDASGSLEFDMRFHAAIADAAHNQVLANSVQLLRNLVTPWLLLKHKLPAEPSKSFASHDQIYDAILHRDPKRAGEEMRRHLSSSGHIVIEVVDRR